jgi:putative membrane protein
MKYPFNCLLKFICLIAAVSLWVACGNKSLDDNGSDTSRRKAEEVNKSKFDQFGEKDAKYLLDIYMGGLNEIAFALHAKSKTTNKIVKDLADSVITYQSAINAALKNLASKKGISLPEQLDENKADELRKEQDKNVDQFEKYFSDKTLDDYKEYLKFIQQAADECRDKTISNLFTSLEPKLRELLTTIMLLRERLKQ